MGQNLGQGVMISNTNVISLNELSGGSRISCSFLSNAGIKSTDTFDRVKDGVHRFVRSSYLVSRYSCGGLGVDACTLRWIVALEIILKQQIKRLKGPRLQCCQLVYDKLIPGQLLKKIKAFCQPPHCVNVPTA
ncbi:hypothetical protein V8E53_000887 [Lactarius tabidus]